MAGPGPSLMALGHKTGKVTLDEVREWCWVSLRANERQSEGMRDLCSKLDGMQKGDEWLELTQDELEKGCRFFEDQFRQWEAFKERIEGYVAEVRQVADQLALAELSVEGASAADVEAAEEVRIIHPELQRFKQEKIAKIIGKYGGQPAFGAGHVLGRMPRDAILKATASPAAREITYSKMEGKEARDLAQVMRFKVRKEESEVEKAAVSPWQAEVKEKKGKEYFADREQGEKAAATSMMGVAAGASPLNDELSSRLQARQAAIKAHDEAEAQAAKKQPERDPLAAANDELASKLGRRQAELKAQQQAEEEVAKAAAKAAALAAAAADNTPPPPPAWSAASPFGAELVSKMQEKAMAEAAAAAAAAAAAEAAPVSASTPTPGTRPLGGRAPSASPATPFTFAKPQGAGGSRFAGATPVTPPGGGSELADILKRRQQKIQQQESSEH